MSAATWFVVITASIVLAFFIIDSKLYSYAVSKVRGWLMQRSFRSLERQIEKSMQRYREQDQ